MTERQKKFLDEYSKSNDIESASQLCGYKNVASCKKMLKRPEIVKYLNEVKVCEDRTKLATQEEIIAYLTQVIRGEAVSEVVVVENVGDGYTEAVKVSKKPDGKEKLEAVKLLGKFFNMFDNSVKVEGVLPVSIINDIEAVDCRD